MQRLPNAAFNNYYLCLFNFSLYLDVVVNGRLRCLGPAQHLKLRFGNGFEVNIKLSAPPAEQLYHAMQVALLQIRSSSNSSTDAAAATESTVTSPLEAFAALPDTEAQTTNAMVAGAQSSSAAAGLSALDNYTLKRAHLQCVGDGLGKPARCALIAPFQSGALLHDAFTAEGEEIPLRMFLEWWLYEDVAEGLQQFMCAEFGARAQLLERSTAQNFRYRVQLHTTSTSATLAEEEGGGQEGEGTGSSNCGQENKSQQSGQQPATASAAPAAQNALSDIFARFEAHKQALGILEYSVGQTTLEQIFNQFAAQQDNPEVQAAHEAAAAQAALVGGASALSGSK